MTARTISAVEYLAIRIEPTEESIPKLTGIQIYGRSSPANGIVGGDLIDYVNFSVRYDLDSRIAEAKSAGRLQVAANLERLRRLGGILVANVAGHEEVDAVTAYGLHESFHMGALAELDRYGEITTRLFEYINTRFCKSKSARNRAGIVGADATKFITMLYGEIKENGRFRFLSAAHPPPLVFSYQFNRIVDICTDRLKSFPPIGMQPSEDSPDRKRYHSLRGYKIMYTINELNLMGHGDILLLYTDGIYDGTDAQRKDSLERLVIAAKNATAKEICDSIMDSAQAWGPPEEKDDMSLVVVKRE